MLQDVLGIFRDLLEHIWAFYEVIAIKSPPVKWSRGAKGDVVLVPGFSGTWTSLKHVGNLLNSLGYKVHTLPKLGYNFMTIKDASIVLEEYIINNNLQNAVLIAHSKGGLISKYFLVHSRYRNRIRKAICIATPFKGALPAYFRILNLHEFFPHSKFLIDLNKNTSINRLFVNIYPRLDPVIMIRNSSSLSGAKNFQIDTVGHLNILMLQQTLETIRNNI